MAATLEAQRLTEAHRKVQLRVGVETISQLAATWRLLDPENLDDTLDRWLRVALPIIRSQRTRSARLAANYLTTFRSLEIGMSVGFAPVLAEVAAAEAVTTSLVVTGPASVRSALKRGVPIAKAVETAQAKSAASGMRHVLNGGRDTIINTIDSDPRALGFARAVSGKPCHFCAMLASRGPVYKSQQSGGFQAHDHCSCAVEPVYRRDADWPAGSRRYQELWDEVTAGKSGGEAISAFRAALA